MPPTPPAGGYYQYPTANGKKGVIKSATLNGDDTYSDNMALADGADVAQGSTSDPPVTDPQEDATAISLLKGLLTQLTGAGSGPLGSVSINQATPGDTNGVSVVAGAAPSFLSPAPIPATYAADDSVTTVYTLDLTQKSGAWLYPAIGRQAASALTRAAYIAVRPSLNGSAAVRLPGTNYDFVSATAAVGGTTLNGATSVGATTATLTSATTFAVGDWVCFSSPDTSGLRVEFARIRKIATNTLTFERPLLLAHNDADRVTSAADLFGRIWIPGGDKYDIYGVNNSGQAVIFQCEAATFA